MKRMNQVVAALAAMVLLGMQAPSTDAFQLGPRWNRTAISGSGLGQGDPTVLTWGYVADGTNIVSLGSSDFISTFDSWFGAGPGGTDLTQRPWHTYFEQSFGRYAELSGLSYQYEPADDGASQGSGSFRGMVGVRADVRIAGDFIDGDGGGGQNTLAFNNFPQNGDMTIDTGDASGFTNPSNDHRFLRNVIMHEHGHGTGFRHVESVNSGQLMEPLIQTFFDGPQFDEVLGIQRAYGDVNEKSNAGMGNDTANTATDLGALAVDSNITIGTNANNVFVNTFEIDFVSIDDNSDTDYFSFTLAEASVIDVVLEPMGPTYRQGPQGGPTPQPFLVTKELSNLSLSLYDTDGLSVLDTQNVGGLGETESILDFNLNPGEYFVRVSGAANNVQMYQLDVAAESGMQVDPGDFDANGLFECADVDALVAEIVAGTNDGTFDLTGEGVVNTGDLTEWLALAGAANLASGASYLLGDANLDGTVDGGDFLEWNGHKFTTEASWCHGDFTADGEIDGGDFLVWNSNKFTSADTLAAVPEPASRLGFLIGFLCLGRFRRR